MTNFLGLLCLPIYLHLPRVVPLQSNSRHWDDMNHYWDKRGDSKLNQVISKHWNPGNTETLGKGIEIK